MCALSGDSFDQQLILASHTAVLPVTSLYGEEMKGSREALSKNMQASKWGMTGRAGVQETGEAHR
jgi:hypothetical protein